MNSVEDLFKYDKGIKNHNKDIFTTVVRIRGGKTKVCPVRTSKAVDISMFKEISKALGRVYVSAPVEIGSVVCKNILNTGSDIVTTKTIDK